MSAQPQPASASRPAGVSAAAIREQLALITAAVGRVEGQLQRLEGDGPPSRERARPDRYYAVLVDVYERGVHGVDQEAFWAIGARYGYDRRGLGGFFAGSRAPLQLASRVTLTAEGMRLVDLRLETLPEPA